MTARKTRPAARSEAILIRLSPDERAALTKEARRTGIGLGPWLRMLGLRDAASRDVRGPREGAPGGYYDLPKADMLDAYVDLYRSIHGEDAQPEDAFRDALRRAALLAKADGRPLSPMLRAAFARSGL